MLGLSREHGAGGVLEEQESDIQVPACPGGGDIAKSRLCSKAARDFDFGEKLK